MPGNWSYQPDLPTDTPNTWRLCDGFHPDIYGNYRTGWLPSAAISTAVGSGRIFTTGHAYLTAAGTTGVVMVSPDNATGFPGTKAYVWNASTWNDRTGTLASGTTGAAPAYLQVGNVTLVGTPSGLWQRDATTTNNFAAVGAGSPGSVGALAISSLNITLAIATDSDAWATSDTNTPLTWNSGEAASGNLRQMPGNNTACIGLGPDFLIFKQRGVWRHQYVGGSLKWTTTLIDKDKGAWGQGSVVAANGKVYFIGNAGVWSFDGAAFERCDAGIWATLLGTLGVSGAFVSGFNNFVETKLVFDSVSQNIFFWGLALVDLSTRGVSALYFYTYNVVSRKWGKQTRLGDQSSTDAVYAVFNVAALNTMLTTWGSGDGSGGRSFNTDVGLYSSTNDKVEALSKYFNTTDVPGTNYKPMLRTSRFGRADRETTIRRFTPGWTLADGRGTDLSTATVKEGTPFTAVSKYGSNTTGTTANLSGNGNWLDYQMTARFHNVELHINCDAVIDGGDWDSVDAGAN